MFFIVTNISCVFLISFLLILDVRKYNDHEFHRTLYDIEFLCKEKVDIDKKMDIAVLNKYLHVLPELNNLLDYLKVKVKYWRYEEIIEEIDNIRFLYFLRIK